MGTNQDEIPALKDRYGLDFAGVFENEVPSHEVTIGDFQLDQCEVTNSRYAEFLEARPEWHRDNLAASRHNGRYLDNWEGGQYPDDSAQQPVVFIIWSAAQSFCRWRGESSYSLAR